MSPLIQHGGCLPDRLNVELRNRQRHPHPSAIVSCRLCGLSERSPSTVISTPAAFVSTSPHISIRPHLDLVPRLDSVPSQSNRSSRRNRAQSHTHPVRRAYPQCLHARARDRSLRSADNHSEQYIEPTHLISVLRCRLGSTSLTAVIYLLPSCHRATTANCRTLATSHPVLIPGSTSRSSAD